MKRWSPSVTRNLRLPRLRHYRGHGVHSPFVYAMIRQALMHDDRSLRTVPFYDVLRQAGTSIRTASQIVRIYRYCGYDGFTIVSGSSPLSNRPNTFYIVPGQTMPDGKLAALVRSSQGACCLLAPNASRKRKLRCRAMLNRHPGTSIDKRDFLLLFYRAGLPKQHFKL